MKRKSFFCFFFIVLLISPAPVLAETLEEVKDTRKKRQVGALLPLASYTGMTVGAPLFLALVAAYGIYAVTRYAIKKGMCSHIVGLVREYYPLRSMSVTKNLKAYERVTLLCWLQTC